MIDATLPIKYAPFTNQLDYEAIFYKSLEILGKFGDIKSASDGEIVITGTQYTTENLHFFLDNIVRRCNQVPKDEWAKLIESHFSNFTNNPSKDRYIWKDYDYARQFLRVQVRPELPMPVSNKNELFYRRDFPGTYSVLVLDYDNKLQYFKRPLVKEWNKTDEELFEDALDNVAAEKMYSSEINWNEAYDINTFANPSYAASYLIELERNAPQAVGRFGAIVAIPLRTFTIAHPLDSIKSYDFIGHFKPMVLEYLKQDDIPVSEKFYWYYKGKYEGISDHIRDGKMFISMPEKLYNLINKADDDDDDDD